MAYPVAVTACDAVIQLDDDGGTPVDISGQGNEVTYAVGQGSGRFKTFGNDWFSAVTCGLQADITLRMVFTTAGQQARALLEDWFYNHPTDARSLTLQIPDSSVGSQQYDMEVKITALNINLSAEDASPLMIEVTLINDGAVSISTILS